MKGLNGIVGQGVLKTFVSKPGEPLAPEQWAEVITGQIISVADTTAEPLRTMALDLRADIFKILTHYVSQIREEQAAYFALKKE